MSLGEPKTSGKANDFPKSWEKRSAGTKEKSTGPRLPLWMRSPESPGPHRKRPSASGYSTDPCGFLHKTAALYLTLFPCGSHNIRAPTYGSLAGDHQRWRERRREEIATTLSLRVRAQAFEGEGSHLSSRKEKRRCTARNSVSVPCLVRLPDTLLSIQNSRAPLHTAVQHGHCTPAEIQLSVCHTHPAPLQENHGKSRSYPGAVSVNSAFRSMGVTRVHDDLELLTYGHVSFKNKKNLLFLMTL